MQKYLILLLLVLLAKVYPDTPKNWSIVKSSSPLSSRVEFAINKEGLVLEKVVREGLFTPRYFYDLYDTHDTLEMRGVTRAFSLGFLYAWGMEIDLCVGEQIVGLIQGEFFTNSRAKFVFYDSKKEPVAYASLHDESCNFLIVSIQKPGAILAELNGKIFGDACVWEMKLTNEPLPIDEKALKIFSGFVSDYHQHFVRHPETVIIYTQNNYLQRY